MGEGVLVCDGFSVGFLVGDDVVAAILKWLDSVIVIE